MVLQYRFAIETTEIAFERQNTVQVGSKLSNAPLSVDFRFSIYLLN